MNNGRKTNGSFQIRMEAVPLQDADSVSQLGCSYMLTDLNLI